MSKKRLSPYLAERLYDALQALLFVGKEFRDSGALPFLKQIGDTPIEQIALEMQQRACAGDRCGLRRLVKKLYLPGNMSATEPLAGEIGGTMSRLRHEARNRLALHDVGIRPATVTPPESPADDKAETPTPKTYLLSWSEIMAGLDMKNTKENRRRVLDMNTNYQGPIVPPKRGGQPKAEKGGLVVWWNHLECHWQDQINQEAGKRETVNEQYKHGRKATIVPGIAGHIQDRKKSKT